MIPTKNYQVIKRDMFNNFEQSYLTDMSEDIAHLCARAKSENEKPSSHFMYIAIHKDYKLNQQKGV